MNQKIAIIGPGKVGSALQSALSRAGHEVRSAKRGQIVPTASWADVIILAVPFRAVPEVARELGTAADGKTLVDVTNSLTPDFQLAIGFTTTVPKSYRRRSRARMWSRPSTRYSRST